MLDRKAVRLLALIPLVMLILVLTVLPLPGQAPARTYFYVATAVDSTGNESVNSNEVSATPTAAKPHVVLSWTASTSTVAGYNVYRATTSGGPYTKLNSTPVTAVTFTDLVAFPNPPTALTAVSN